MQFVHRDFPFELDDLWWDEAGMTGFVPGSRAYRFDPVAFPDAREIRIDDVEPLRKRKLSHGVFNDETEGPTAKERVVRILRGFVAGDAIPPVEIVELSGPQVTGTN